MGDPLGLFGLFGKSTVRRRAAPRHQLELTPLEDRILPSSVNLLLDDILARAQPADNVSAIYAEFEAAVDPAQNVSHSAGSPEDHRASEKPENLPNGGGDGGGSGGGGGGTGGGGGGTHGSSQAGNPANPGISLNDPIFQAASAGAVAGDGGGALVPKLQSGNEGWRDYAGGGRDHARQTAVITLDAPKSAVSGQKITINARVTTSGGAGMANGLVIFKDGGTTLGAGAVKNGSASFSTANLSVGTHALTAQFFGGAHYADTSAATLVAVGKADARLTLNQIVSPFAFDKPVTLLATVTAVAPGAGRPGGSVTFLHGDKVLGSGTLQGGRLLFNSATLSKDVHHLTAVYSGDANFKLSTATLNDPAGTIATTTTVSPLVNPISLAFTLNGAHAIVTATVTGGGGTPTGSIIFMENGSFLNSVEVRMVNGVPLPEMFAFLAA